MTDRNEEKVDLKALKDMLPKTPEYLLRNMPSPRNMYGVPGNSRNQNPGYAGNFSDSYSAFPERGQSQERGYKSRDSDRDLRYAA